MKKSELRELIKEEIKREFGQPLPTLADSIEAKRQMNESFAGRIASAFVEVRDILEHLEPQLDKKTYMRLSNNLKKYAQDFRKSVEGKY